MRIGWQNFAKLSTFACLLAPTAFITSNSVRVKCWKFWFLLLEAELIIGKFLSRIFIGADRFFLLIQPRKCTKCLSVNRVPHRCFPIFDGHKRPERAKLPDRESVIVGRERRRKLRFPIPLRARRKSVYDAS